MTVSLPQERTLPMPARLARLAFYLPRTVRALRKPERRFWRSLKIPIDPDRRPSCAPRKTAMFARLLAVLGLLAAIAGAQPAVAQESITVFAAASLKNALDDTDATFTKATGVKVVASYAASSALAKQIESGAPADVFISADLKWMDYVADKKLIKADTRVNLLGNRLVLIAPADSKLGNVKIEKGFDIAKLAGDGRIAVADVKAVPAGLYAKAALENLGAWAAAEPKLEPKVRIIGVFPDGSYPPVTYPAAETAASKSSAAARYLTFLRGAAAK